jgi:pilus assembly protein TadC
VWPRARPSWPRAGSGGTPQASGGPTGQPAPPESATPGTVADALVLLALALRAGAGLGEALEETAARCDGAVRAHLRAVAAARRWGCSDTEAWAYAPSVWGPAAHAWHVATVAGAGPADLIEQAAAGIREREDRRLEGATARAGVLLVMPLALCFLPAFACTAVIPVVLVLAQSLLGP